MVRHRFDVDSALSREQLVAWMRLRVSEGRPMDGPLVPTGGYLSSGSLLRGSVRHDRFELVEWSDGARGPGALPASARGLMLARGALTATATGTRVSVGITPWSVSGRLDVRLAVAFVAVAVPLVAWFLRASGRELALTFAIAPLAILLGGFLEASTWWSIKGDLHRFEVLLTDLLQGRT